MNGLHGMRVALLEARAVEPLSMLIRHFGGEPVCVPAVDEQSALTGAELPVLLSWLVDSEAPIILCSTGTGVAALFDEARRWGVVKRLKALLRRSILVARGPKPVAALKRQGLSASIEVPDPYTQAELLDALARLDLDARPVMLLHHGERNIELVQALHEWNVSLHEVVLYLWRLPEDTRPLRGLVEELIEGRIGAVAFTSQIQARHLFEVAEGTGRAGDLAQALRNRVVVAAVGPTCARVLVELGVPPAVVPSPPKMGPMASALARYVEERWRP
ncbi:MAG: uroporphyrinogen-III synthase [Myxococcaceae bacterium]